MKRTAVLLAVLIFAACAAPGKRLAAGGDGITFLHLNDTYRVGAVEDGSRGGFGRVITLLRDVEAEGRIVRLLHGGDFLNPSLESRLWDGQQMIEAFNYMHGLAPMVAVPGNHEFDTRDPAVLAAALRASEFTWVGDNVEFATGNPSADAILRDAFVTEIDGRRIGIFGLTLLPADGGNERDYLDYEPGYVAQARIALETLDDAGAELIIGVTHLHLADDIEVAKLRASYPNFRFIVGGHEHEPEHEPPTPTSAEIMKGASNARVIWRIDVDFDPAGVPRVHSRQIGLDQSVARDPDYQVIVDRWRGRLLERMPFLEARLGVAAVPLDAREVTVRNEESNWGNFIADRMRDAFGQPADLAFLNSGTLRIDDYIIGDITWEDIARTFGFSSYLQYLTISGREFRETLEAGYRGYGPSKGYFPQVSGFRVCVDRSRPDGDRIVQLQLPADAGWQEIEPDRNYLVVAPEFLVGGGDGYAFPADSEPSRPGSELVYLVIDEITDAQADGRAIGEPVHPEKPRIAFAPAPGQPCFR